MNEFLWGIYPYVCIVLFFAVPVIRMATRPFSWSTRASSLFQRQSLGLASTLLHWGLLLVLVGHLIGLFGGLLGSEASIQAFFWTGLVGGVFVLLGSLLALWRRLRIPEVRAMSQHDDYVVHLFLILIVGIRLYQVIAHRIFGIAYNASSWVASLWRFDPQPELMASASVLTQLHVFLALTFFAYFPFTKLVHAWTYPVNYFVRPYQSMRTQRYRFQRKWELAMRSDKSWLVYGLGTVALVFVVFGFLLGRASEAVATVDGDPQMTPDGRLLGEALYVSQCARCHGVSGRGDGAGAKSPTFGAPPRDLVSGAYRFVSTTTGVASSDDLRRTIREGLPPAGMPAFDELTDAQVDSLVAVLNRMRGGEPPGLEPIPLPTEEERRRADMDTGATLYRTHCGVCHGDQGEGDGPAGQGFAEPTGEPILPANFRSGKLKTGTSTEDVYIRMSSGVPPFMPAFHQTLDPVQRWSIARLVTTRFVP